MWQHAARGWWQFWWCAQSIVNGYTVDARKWRGWLPTLVKDFVCKLGVDTKEGIVEPGEEISFFDQIDFVKKFYHLGNRLNASGGSEAAVTARTRIGWIKFRECGELLHGRKFSLKMKGRIYQSCVKTSNVVWERDVVSEGEWDGNFENWKSNDESNVWS